MEISNSFKYGVLFGAGLFTGYYLSTSGNRKSKEDQLAQMLVKIEEDDKGREPSYMTKREQENLKIALDFLHSQDLMDLDLMCSYVCDDIVYVNEPFPKKRDICGKKMFREVFASSPCIWATEAKLEVLQSCCRYVNLKRNNFFLPVFV